MSTSEHETTPVSNIAGAYNRNGTHIYTDGRVYMKGRAWGSWELVTNDACNNETCMFVFDFPDDRSYTCNAKKCDKNDAVDMTLFFVENGTTWTRTSLEFDSDADTDTDNDTDATFEYTIDTVLKSNIGAWYDELNKEAAAEQAAVIMASFKKEMLHDIRNGKRPRYLQCNVGTFEMNPINIAKFKNNGFKVWKTTFSNNNLRGVWYDHYHITWEDDATFEFATQEMLQRDLDLTLRSCVEL